jgi:BsuBI/PstI restriction endonuclease domain/BsuBI/PstI restriction endonuclease HTH domain
VRPVPSFTTRRCEPLSLPPYIDRDTILKRLPEIFPEGTPQRTYCVREAAASAVFTMIYIGAIEGTGRWLGPKQVVRMTDGQAARTSDEERSAYAVLSMKPGFVPRGRTWYSENSREQIRDEGIRQGLIPNNAVIELPVPTTSSKPRYGLRKSFAALFNPALSEEAFKKAAEAWRKQSLSPTALARVTLVRHGAAKTGEGILVTYPNGETRRLAAGPSSVIAKAVIEEFTKRYLVDPAVLSLSESGAKVVHRDDDLAKRLGLKIPADRNLPDIILIDLGESGESHILIIFVEVVATDGPVTPQRQTALLKIATDAGYSATSVGFVTAYLDRSHPAFKKTINELAWRSFAWFASEPEHLLILHDGKEEDVKALSAWLGI